MSDRTGIEWCDATLNPVTGCSKISPACANCYAKRMATRLRGRCGYPKDRPFAVTLHPERLSQLDRWRKPRRIFMVSMGDLFHPDVPVKFINLVTEAMDRNPQHTYMILTKRPKRLCDLYHTGKLYWEPKIIQLGVTVESNDYRWRIDEMMLVPAAEYFVSIEPCLGDVNLGSYLPPMPRPATLGQVILGGETGPGGRPMHPKWVRSIRDQAVMSNTPFMFKGWGEYTPDPYQDWKESEVHIFEDGTRVFKHGRIARKYGLDEYKEIDGVKWPGK